MSNASISAQNMTREALRSGQSLTDLANSLKNTTAKAKATELGLKAVSIAANMLVMYGISLAINAMVHLYNISDKLAQKLDETKSKLSSTTDEIASMNQELEDNGNKIKIIKIKNRRKTKMINIESVGKVSFTDEGETTTFYEGDEVICCIGNDKRYVGKINAVGYWKDSEEDEPYEVISINTSKGDRSYSTEVIKVDEITYMCKNPLKDSIEPALSKEEMDKKTFVSMLVNLGYEKSAVETLWEKMQKSMKYFDIPVEKALACTLYSLENNCDIYEPMKEICGVDIVEMDKMVSDLEKTQTYTIGMAINGLCELFSAIVEYIRGEEEE